MHYCFSGLAFGSIMAPCLSPYPMVGLDEAWSLMIRETFKTVQSKTCKNTNIEYCDNSIQRLIGSFSSNDAEALRDVPPVRVSIMVFRVVSISFNIPRLFNRMVTQYVFLLRLERSFH